MFSDNPFGEAVTITGKQIVMHVFTISKSLAWYRVSTLVSPDVVFQSKIMGTFQDFADEVASYKLSDVSGF